MKHWTVRVALDDNGEECLPIPEELVNELGWRLGDTLIWRQEGDSWVLSKKD